jgi:sulfur-carrier protein
MQVNIILFGQLTDITGSNRIVVNDVTNTDELQHALNKLYPSMAALKYIIAVNKKTVIGNTPIDASSIVAVLPPFSGG